MLLYYLSMIETEEDRAKFEKLYYEYRELMLFVALGVLHNQTLAEDAVQEAFERIVRHIDHIKEPFTDQTKAFIAILTKNMAIDVLRKEKRHQNLHFEDFPFEIGKESDFSKVETDEIVEQIARLPEIYRDVLNLKFCFEYNDREISDLLHISHAAVRKRMERAKVMLADYLGR